MNRSPMPRPTKPMAKMSAKRREKLGGNPKSTFDKPRTQTLTRSPMKASRPKPAVPPKRRKTLADRSEGWCEARLEGCQGQATDPHHRITRKGGGRKGEAKERSDRLSDLLDLCRPCHRWVHAHPANARRMGLLLKETQIPPHEEVSYRGRRVYLDDAGDVHEYEAHCA